MVVPHELDIFMTSQTHSTTTEIMEFQDSCQEGPDMECVGAACLDAKTHKTAAQSLKSAAKDFQNDTRKFVGFVKSRLSTKRRKSKPTKVQSISIGPEVEDIEHVEWATRSTTSSATSRTSEQTTSSVGNDGIEVICDLDDEV